MTDIPLPPKLPAGILTKDVPGYEVASLPNLPDSRIYTIRDATEEGSPQPSSHEIPGAKPGERQRRLVEPLGYEIPDGMTPQEFAETQAIEHSAPDSQKYIYYVFTGFRSRSMGPTALNTWLHFAAEAMGANRIFFRPHGRPSHLAPGAPHTRGKLKEFVEAIDNELGPSFAICAFARWRAR